MTAKHRRIALAGLMILAGSATAFCAPTRTEEASGSDKPYQVILERNAFQLKPPPPPPPPPEAPPPPPPKIEIKLTGITTLGGKKKAYFKIINLDSKDEKWYRLTEEEVQDQLEVVAIHPDRGEVEIVHEGSPRTLNFEKDGIQAVAAPAAPATANNPAAAAAAAKAAQQRRPPGMNLPSTRRPGATPVPTPTQRPPGVSVQPTSRNALRTTPSRTASGRSVSTPVRIPTRSVRTSQGNRQTQPRTPPQKVDPDAQALQMEINRNLNPPNFPPLPPTPLTEQEQNNGNQ